MRVSSFGSLKNNRFEAICLALILLGVFVGTLGFVNQSSVYFTGGSAFEIKSNGNILDFNVFLKSFLGNALFLLVIFLCGFSAVLQPVIFACAIVKGMGLGVVASAMYTALGKEGIIDVILSMVFPSLFVVFAIVIGVREAFYMSVSIARAIFTERNFIGLKDASKLYTVKFLVLLTLVALGALAECIIKSIIF